MPQSQNILNAIKIHQPAKNLFDKKPEMEHINKRSYLNKLGCCKSSFRFICLKNEEKQNFKKIEKMLNRVISFENLAKLSKNFIILKNLLLEDYQHKTLDLLHVPKDENFNDINEYMLKMDFENIIDMKIMKLLEDYDRKE
jgi:hypothetical protein